MTFRVNLDLEHFWSITDNGELQVELAPKNRPDDVKAEFTFDRNELLRALGEDLKDKYEDPSLDIDEWDDLINWLRTTADQLEALKKDAFS